MLDSQRFVSYILKRLSKKKLTYVIKKRLIGLWHVTNQPLATRCQRQPVGKISCWQRVANANPSATRCQRVVNGCTLIAYKTIISTFVHNVMKC